MCGDEWTPVDGQIAFVSPANSPATMHAKPSDEEPRPSFLTKPPIRQAKKTPRRLAPLCSRTTEHVEKPLTRQFGIPALC